MNEEMRDSLPSVEQVCGNAGLTKAVCKFR